MYKPKPYKKLSKRNKPISPCLKKKESHQSIETSILELNKVGKKQDFTGDKSMNWK